MVSIVRALSGIVVLMGSKRVRFGKRNSGTRVTRVHWAGLTEDGQTEQNMTSQLKETLEKRAMGSIELAMGAMKGSVGWELCLMESMER
jgi:hypothetical protein